jgi:hypothetical protein
VVLAQQVLEGVGVDQGAVGADDRVVVVGHVAGVVDGGIDGGERERVEVEHEDAGAVGGEGVRRGGGIGERGGAQRWGQAQGPGFHGDWRAIDVLGWIERQGGQIRDGP